jgi:hypothetical protein
MAEASTGPTRSPFAKRPRACAPCAWPGTPRKRHPPRCRIPPRTEAALTAPHEKDCNGSETAVPRLLPPRQPFSGGYAKRTMEGLTKG